MRQPQLPFIRCKLLAKLSYLSLRYPWQLSQREKKEKEFDLSLFLKSRLLLFMTTLWVSSVWASDYDLMLDASGSMRGFKIEKETWEKLLTGLESSARYKYQFGDKHNFKRVNAPLIKVKLRDQETYLGQALKDWLTLSKPGDVVVIITDNVADTGDTGGDSKQSQQLFYDLLSKIESPFSHIAIFPMTIPFKGKVYPISRGKGKAYQGHRALSTYAIARSPFDDEAFQRLRRQIAQHIADFDHEYIQIKPFDSQTVSGLVGEINIDPDSTKDANVRFETDESGIKRLVVRRLRLGQEMKFSFNVNIQSNSSFELQDVELIATIRLNKSEKTRHITMEENFTTAVNPRRATISPEGLQDIAVSFENKAFYFGDLDFLDKLAFTMRNTMTIQGRIELEFNASREDMKLSQGILHSWSYEGEVSQLDKPNPAVQEKVYKLGELVKSMLPEKTAIQKLHSVPVTLELRYPVGPILTVILAALLLLGLLYWLVSRIQEGKEYILEDDMGHETPVALGLGNKYRHDFGDGETLFSLSYWGLGFWVSTPFELRSSRFINNGQAIRISDPETGDEYTWQLREAITKSLDEQDMDW
jgi:hypothetical protein